MQLKYNSRVKHDVASLKHRIARRLSEQSKSRREYRSIALNHLQNSGYLLEGAHECGLSTVCRESQHFAHLLSTFGSFRNCKLFCSFTRELIRERSLSEPSFIFESFFESSLKGGRKDTDDWLRCDGTEVEKLGWKKGSFQFVQII